MEKKKKKKWSRELWKFIKTMFCAPGTEVTSLEPVHSLGNIHNGVFKEFCLLLHFLPLFFSLLFGLCVSYLPSRLSFYVLLEVCCDTIAPSQQALEPLLFHHVIAFTGCIYSSQGAKAGVEGLEGLPPGLVGRTPHRAPILSIRPGGHQSVCRGKGNEVQHPVLLPSPLGPGVVSE